jgi:hypothetical protein
MQTLENKGEWKRWGWLAGLFRPCWSSAGFVRLTHPALLLLFLRSTRAKKQNYRARDESNRDGAAATNKITAPSLLHLSSSLILNQQLTPKDPYQISINPQSGSTFLWELARWLRDRISSRVTWYRSAEAPQVYRLCWLANSWKSEDDLNTWQVSFQYWHLYC